LEQVVEQHGLLGELTDVEVALEGAGSFGEVNFGVVQFALVAVVDGQSEAEADTCAEVVGDVEWGDREETCIGEGIEFGAVSEAEEGAGVGVFEAIEAGLEPDGGLLKSRYEGGLKDGRGKLDGGGVNDSSEEVEGVEVGFEEDELLAEGNVLGFEVDGEVHEVNFLEEALLNEVCHGVLLFGEHGDGFFEGEEDAVVGESGDVLGGDGFFEVGLGEGAVEGEGLFVELDGLELGGFGFVGKEGLADAEEGGVVAFVGDDFFVTDVSVGGRDEGLGGEVDLGL